MAARHARDARPRRGVRRRRDGRGRRPALRPRLQRRAPAVRARAGLRRAVPSFLRARAERRERLFRDGPDADACRRGRPHGLLQAPVAQLRAVLREGDAPHRAEGTDGGDGRRGRGRGVVLRRDGEEARRDGRGRRPEHRDGGRLHARLLGADGRGALPRDRHGHEQLHGDGHEGVRDSEASRRAAGDRRSLLQRKGAQADNPSRSPLDRDRQPGRN